LHVYPIDKRDDEGKPFWSLPKRPPRVVDFDPINEMHQNVIASFSCLIAKMHGIKNPYEQPRSEMAKQNMAIKASKIEVPQFVPNELKAQ
jgi:hypothetical protein